MVYFIFVAPMNAAKDRFTNAEEELAEETELLREIRDLLKARNATVDVTDGARRRQQALTSRAS